MNTDDQAAALAQAGRALSLTGERLQGLASQLEAATTQLPTLAALGQHDPTLLPFAAHAGLEQAHALAGTFVTTGAALDALLARAQGALDAAFAPEKSQ